ncbi:MAG: rhomboid family intramembrane serine protease [candidate division WOR-3 bacterium]|nr:rhomboid family intramembrane serine protease [candidate division WOR-3 bacterium]
MLIFFREIRKNWMIIPIGNTGNLRRAPFITIGLIVICILVYMFIRPSIAKHDRMFMEERTEYVNLVVEWLIAEEEYSYEDMIANPDKLSDEIESPSVEITSEYYDDIQRAKEEMEEARSKHIFYTLGVSRNNMNPVKFISSIFTHASLPHLLGNLWFLLLLGANVEDTYGRFNFLVFFILSGIVSSVIFILSQQDPSNPLIGASGAIAGVMGVFMIRHFTTKIKFFYFFFPVRPLMGTFRLMAGIVLPLWFIQQITDALNESNSQVAFMAHIGGFIFGVGSALIIEHFNIEERFIRPQIEEQTNLLGTTRMQQEGIDAYYRGEFDTASNLLAGETDGAANSEVFIPLFASLVETDRKREAQISALHFFSSLKSSERCSEIKEKYDELQSMDMHEFLDESTLFIIVRCLAEETYSDEAGMIIAGVLEDSAPSILRAKMLKYAYKEHIPVDNFNTVLDNYIEQGDDEIRMIIQNIRRNND